MLEKLGNPNRTEREFVCSVLMDLRDDLTQLDLIDLWDEDKWPYAAAVLRAIEMLEAEPVPSYRPVDVLLGVMIGSTLTGLCTLFFLSILL